MYERNRDPSRTTTPAQGVLVCDHAGLVINEFSSLSADSAGRLAGARRVLRSGGVTFLPCTHLPPLEALNALILPLLYYSQAYTSL